MATPAFTAKSPAWAPELWNIVQRTAARRGHPENLMMVEVRGVMMYAFYPDEDGGTVRVLCQRGGVVDATELPEAKWDRTAARWAGRL